MASMANQVVTSINNDLLSYSGQPGNQVASYINHMNVVNWDGFEPVPAAITNSVIAIGNFDGVHQGHAALLRRLRRLKQKMNCPSLAVTFNPSPTAILRPQLIVEPLTTLNDRLKWMTQHRLDAVLILKTSPELLEITAEQFWQQLLLRDLRIRGMVEGRNFCFGKDRLGTVEQLRQWSAQADIPFEMVDDVYRHGMRISSSEIRQALKRGDMKTVLRALGRPYNITGRVVHGEHRGQTIGFPTCNLADIATLIPHDGVYAAMARCPQKEVSCAAAVNIGPNPTFGGSVRKVEAHLLDFTGSLYDQPLSLDLVARLRDTRRFAGIDELKQQLHHDVEQTRQIISSYQERRQHAQR